MTRTHMKPLARLIVLPVVFGMVLPPEAAAQRSRGSVHSRAPVASPTKLSTVFGASVGSRRARNDPFDVTNVAVVMGGLPVSLDVPMAAPSRSPPTSSLPREGVSSSYSTASARRST